VISKIKEKNYQINNLYQVRMIKKFSRKL